VPKIDAYSDGVSVLSADKTQRITAYRCPFTNELYRTRTAYKLHLRDLRSDYRIRRRKERTAAEFKDKQQELWRQTSFDDIINWLHSNQDFIDHGHGAVARRNLGHSGPTEFKITKLRLQFSECVSNTHDCPHDGVLNWDRKPGRPTGYPGWDGVINFETGPDFKGCGSETEKFTRIHMGTGGASRDGKTGIVKYNYGVKFFLADWPGLEEMLVWNKLHGFDNGYPKQND